jgi:hypothetical protein
MTDDITRRYHKGHPRSEEAPEDTRKHKARYEMRILRLLHTYSRGLTCDEAEVLLGMSHQTCSARFSELKAKGWLEPTGEQRLTRSGSKADVFRSSAAVRDVGVA